MEHRGPSGMFSPLGIEEHLELLRLVVLAGGWWHWPMVGKVPSVDGQKFVSLDEWKRIYEGGEK